MNTSFLPSGENSTPPASVERLVIWRALDPSAFMIQTCAEPPRSEMKAICLESGDHRGPLVVGALGRDLPRQAAARRHQVDLLRLGVLREIDGLDGERDGLAVGRKLRLADPRDLQQRLHVEGLLLRRSGCSKHQRQAYGSHQ